MTVPPRGAPSFHIYRLTLKLIQQAIGPNCLQVYFMFIWCFESFLEDYIAELQFDLRVNEEESEKVF